MSSIANGSAGRRAPETFVLQNGRGLRAKVSSYGGTILELHVPDRNGQTADVVLGLARIEDYERKSPYFGATVGRMANRVRDSRFVLDGKTYTLAANDPPHHLHGGVRGWDKVVWLADPSRGNTDSALTLTHTSPAGDEGYPGAVEASVTYRLTDTNELRVEMTARALGEEGEGGGEGQDDGNASDGEATAAATATIVNMVHHTYWNLGGHDSGTVLDHALSLAADEYTPGDPVVPTGAVLPVRGTPFDFTSPKAIGRDLEAAKGHPLGYDHNFVVRGDARRPRPVARLEHPASGRVMVVEADQPGVQFYSGNFLDGTLIGKSGKPYVRHAGLCLETQSFPNAINVPAWKDQVILRAGQTYRHTMIHRFTTE